MIQFVFCLVALCIIAYVHKKIENPYVKFLLMVLAAPLLGYVFLYWLLATDSPLASALPCILVIGFIIFKAVQWQRQKSKSKAEDSD